MKILFADDETGLADLVAKRLGQKGHEIDIAHDGENALDLIEKKSYDVAFLDFSMPEKTGLEILDKLKERHLKTKTVLVSGYQFLNHAFLKTVGVDEYLTKPFRLEDVESILEKFQS